MQTSFIVIAYNEAYGIEDTLRAIMAQTNLRDYELIVVNDGSQDATGDIVATLAADHPVIKLINQPNQGRGAARATGVSAATGAYLAFIDADIVLPQDWYQQCMDYLDRYDAVSGTALPDGDASFVYRVCKLKPKVTDQSTTVTGSNGLFKRSVFTAVAYDPTKKNGEDVALGYAMDAAGISTTSIPGLVVDHREYKTYRTSLSWLFESGVGASLQLYEHPRIRLPDLAFFGFCWLLVACVISGLTPWWPLVLLATVGYVTLSAFMHLNSKFHLGFNLRSAAGLACNTTLLAAYYAGRLVGLVTEWKKR